MHIPVVFAIIRIAVPMANTLPCTTAPAAIVTAVSAKKLPCAVECAAITTDVPALQKMLSGLAPPWSTTFAYGAIVIVVVVRNTNTARSSCPESKMRSPVETVDGTMSGNVYNYIKFQI